MIEIKIHRDVSRFIDLGVRWSSILGYVVREFSIVGRVTRVIGDVLETMRLECSRYRRSKIRTPASH